MSWNKEYNDKERIWGESPSDLAVVAVRYLQECKSNNELLRIVDIGCGYGRDVLYFSTHLRCTVLGIDNSEKAIDMARTICHNRSNERKYDEPHVTGVTHHHSSWIVIGQAHPTKHCAAFLGT